MKNIYYIILLPLISFIFILTSCDRKVEEHNTRWDGEKTYKLGDKEPYTGTVQKKDSEGRVVRETKVKNGEDIEVIKYYKNGNIKIRQEGSGEEQYYSPDGEKIIEDEYYEKYRGE